MIFYYVDAINGSDVNNGSEEQPFQTLDYCINNMNKTYDNDVTIYLKDGNYSLSTRTLFTGKSNKMLIFVGNCIKTSLVLEQTLASNSSYGTKGFNIYFRQLILKSNMRSYLATFANLRFENVLFFDLKTESLYVSTSAEKNSYFKNCVNNNSNKFLLDESPFLQNETIGNYGEFNGNRNQQIDFPNAQTNFITQKPKLNDIYQITDINVQTSKIGLYAGKYAWAEQDCLIKIDNKYYSILEEFWDTETKQFNEVGALNFEKSFKLDLLTKEVTYVEDTFVPLEKFDNFKIVFKDNRIKKLNLNAYKITEKTIEYDLDVRMVGRFNTNGVTVNGENVKVLMCFNEEPQIYKFDFITNGLVEEDKINIKTNGNNLEEIQNIDFESIKNNNFNEDLRKIKFYFYLQKDSVISDITLNYNSLGEYIQDNNSNIRLGYKKITITPNYTVSRIKVNIL